MTATGFETSLKLQISYLCRFTLKCVHDMIITYSQWDLMFLCISLYIKGNESLKDYHLIRDYKVFNVNSPVRSCINN